MGNSHKEINFVTRILFVVLCWSGGAPFQKNKKMGQWEDWVVGKTLVIHVPAAIILSTVVLCPLVAYLLHWDHVTSTHCRVENFLASVSSVIGNKTPERYIWRIGVALVSSPLYLKYIVNYICKKRRNAPYFMNTLNFFAKMVENTCLILLTFVSSTENHDAHEVFFIGWVIFQTIGLWSAFFLNRSEGGEPSNGKTYLFVANQGALMAAPYFYHLHNGYCLPNAYSMFALCEWTIVGSNVLFHVLSIPRDYPLVFPELKEKKNLRKRKV